MRRLVLLASVIVAACGSGAPISTRVTPTSPVATSAPIPVSSPTTAPTETPTAPTVPSDALSQMEIAFIGNPGQPEIKALLERAFDIYDLELTEENMSRAASSLVALRLDAEKAGRDDITEMALLEAMVADGGLPGLTFPEAAGWVSAAMRLDP